MRLGLGNNLVKTAFPIGTSPSLDLAFALDRSFTTDPAAAGNALITSRRGPSAKFSRGSGATQVNAAGLIEYAPENLLLRSQDQSSNANWPLLNGATKNANSSIGLDGTQSATTVIFSSDAFSLIFGNYNQPATINTPLTFSVWVSSTSAKKFRLAIFGSPQVYSSKFTSTPTLTRYSFTVANPNNNSINACIVNESGGGAGEIVIWGAQLERASAARTYYPTTTAAFYGPRFDHDPATGASKGLLIEEGGRTNLIINSGNASLWPVANGTVTNLGFITSPDGQTNGYKVELSGANINTPFANTVAGAHTTSVFLKRENTDWVRVQFVYGTNVASANAWFNLATGQVGVVGAGIAGLTSISANLLPYGNGWYRCYVTATTPGNLTVSLSIISATADGNTTRLSGAIYNIWGGQIEAGAFATSYIPTTSGTAARSADVCSIIGSDFSSFYNVAEGTIFASINEFRRGTTYSSYIAFRNNINTSSERITIGAYGTKTSVASPIEGFISAGGIAGYTPRPTAIQQPFNVSLGYALDNCRMALDGALGVADVAPTAIPSTVNELSLSAAGGMGHHISRFQYFRKRLPDAKLQTLTAP